MATSTVVAIPATAPAAPDGPRVRRVAIFGTHPKQFNGYSKVVYELCKAMVAGHGGEVKMHVFGFQNFHNHPGHRNDVPIEVDMYDAHLNENPKQQGFGVPLVKAYVERVRPDVCVVFNDLMVLTSVLNELKDAANRADFRVVAYIDQVYLCQRRDFVEFVNLHADAAMAFTPEWRDCIVGQGLRLPCHVLVHGINAKTYFPVPRRLVRRFYSIAEDDFLVLNLNRNQPRKRWDTCLQAFAEVVARRPAANIKLVIATELKGAWDLIEILQRELKKRGVDPVVAAGRVVIPGHPQMLTDQETNVLSNIADIGINTCDGEGFGLCNFEQAAVGIPQIVPRIGGFVHFFDDSCALMVDPVTSIYVDTTRDGVGGEAQISRAADFADAILKYYDDPALRGRHGRAARARITEGFPWSRIADDFARVVEATCALPSRAPTAAAASASAAPSVAAAPSAAAPAAAPSGASGNASPSDVAAGAAAAAPVAVPTVSATPATLPSAPMDIQRALRILGGQPEATPAAAATTPPVVTVTAPEAPVAVPVAAFAAPVVAPVVTVAAPQVVIEILPENKDDEPIKDESSVREEVLALKRRLDQLLKGLSG
jgi:glycosyltransferase involved in cell wall biosynthesis